MNLKKDQVVAVNRNAYSDTFFFINQLLMINNRNFRNFPEFLYSDRCARISDQISLTFLYSKIRHHVSFYYRVYRYIEFRVVSQYIREF